MPKPGEICEGLRNEDVEWDGTFCGLKPSIKASSIDATNMLGVQDLDSLVELLSDADRYIIAHVLLVKLTKRSGMQGTEKWYGLTVRLKGDGTVEYDTSEREELESDWRKWLARQPKNWRGKME
jgi:hypothetical protein